MADQQVVSEPWLELFARCTRTLARGDELDDILQNMIQTALDATEAAAGAVFVLDNDRQELNLAVGVGIVTDRAFAEADQAADEHQRFAVSLTGGDRMVEAVRQMRPVVASVADGPVRLLELTGLTTALFIPLAIVRGGIDQVVGAFGLCWDDPAAAETAEPIASAIGDLAAVAVDWSRSRSMSAERSDYQQRLAHTDPLTGLANRRTLDRMLELELARAGRQGSEVTLAIFDVDGLATTNQNDGRLAGDQILRTVASVLAESVRLVDTVARYGADEFVVVAPGSAGLVVANRVIEAVSRLAEAGGPGMSVSAGVARFPEEGTTPDELFATAEAGLRAAKDAGGGQVGTTAGASES